MLSVQAIQCNKQYVIINHWQFQCEWRAVVHCSAYPIRKTNTYTRARALTQAQTK